MPQVSTPLLPQQGQQRIGHSEDSSRGLVKLPYSRQQKTSTASEQSVQKPLSEEAAVARKAQDLQNEPARPAGLSALEQAEADVLPGLTAPLGVASHPIDAATALHARPLFRARTEDGY
jgi:hypothetical protein